MLFDNEDEDDGEVGATSPSSFLILSNIYIRVCVCVYIYIYIYRQLSTSTNIFNPSSTKNSSSYTNLMLMESKKWLLELQI